MKKQVAQGRLMDGDPLLMSCLFLNLVMADVLFKTQLNVERTMTATQRRTQADALSMFSCALMACNYNRPH